MRPPSDLCSLKTGINPNSKKSEIIWLLLKTILCNSLFIFSGFTLSVLHDFGLFLSSLNSSSKISNLVILGVKFSC
ncbi:hypothetical protein [Moraxella lacunata]|uniref:hypothetical protein n=1 Tax=Moraxella lacunata TaxID=477 RepID=UPI003EE2E96E